VAASNLDLALHRTMCRIRAFEEAALAAHAAGEVPGVLHVSIGQEAVAAGVCAALGPDDLITSNHRGHGHALAKGADPSRMMAELLGRAPGFCGGRGGSMHIADFSVGMLGANGVVAGGIPIAVGAAMGLRLRGERAVVACFFGDGAVNRGPFLEGLNWAALYKLPVLFVCEDNGVAAFTPTEAATAGPGAAARAEACGVKAETLDGNDAPRIAAAAIAAVASMRAGGGPKFLHCRTYRLRGHTMSDPAAWRDPAQVAAAEAREPIGRLALKLAEDGATGGFLETVREEAAAEMAAAREFAVAAPWPEDAAALSEVQTLGAPVLGARVLGARVLGARA
jgi:pyruvate dehydrogenase E1 component alpha subunit